MTAELEGVSSLMAESLVELALLEHSRRTRTVVLGDEPGPRFDCPSLGGPFSNLRATSLRYKQALGNSLIRLRRYEKSLIAWDETLPTTDEETQETLIVDYVIPLLHTAEDLPLIVKDQIVHAVVSIELLSQNDSYSKVQEIKQGQWVGEFHALVEKDDGLIDLNHAINSLWDEDAAKALRNRHGRRLHDVERQLLGPIPFSSTIQKGVDITGLEPALCLGEEIELIDAQRLNAETAYEHFSDYVKSRKRIQPK